MCPSIRPVRIAGGVLAGLACLSLAAIADDNARSPLQVIIERAPFQIRDPATYDVPLKLRPIRQVTLVALVEGIVQPFRLKVGEKVQSQSELLRLDSRVQQLEVDRAAAALQAAQQEQEKGGAPARVAVAQAELALAQLRLEQTLLRMPWDGLVLEIHVAEGKFVRAGDPLVTVADPTKLTVEVPIDRRAVKEGDRVELKVEEVSAQGVLTAIRPLPERLDPLRGLFQSVAAGIVVLDNADGRFLPGQTCYSPLIPRHPVGEAPAAAIANTEQGGRKVQVIRDGVIRDIPVQLLGQVGEEYVWISGRFSPDDQLILRTSEPLPDGTLVTPRNVVDAQGAPATTPAAPRPPTRPRTGDF